MTRVHHVGRARHSYPGIERGESYYWWKFRHGNKFRSKTPPLPSQLTQSPFWSALYGIQESCSGVARDDDTQDDTQEQVEFLRSALQDLLDETQEKVDNVPESLTDSPTTELLNGRVEALGEAIDELDSLDSESPDCWDDAVAIVGGVSCD